MVFDKLADPFKVRVSVQETRAMERRCPGRGLSLSMVYPLLEAFEFGKASKESQAM